MAEERLRKAAKGWLSRVTDKIEALCSVSASDRKGEWHIDASVALSKFDKRLSSFDDAQCAVEAVIDEEKLLDDIKSGTFRDL